MILTLFSFLLRLNFPHFFTISSFSNNFIMSLQFSFFLLSDFCCVNVTTTVQKKTLFEWIVSRRLIWNHEELQSLLSIRIVGSTNAGENVMDPTDARHSWTIGDLR